MQLNQYFKSIIDQDNCAIVICDLNHKIIYLNPQAEINYAKSGGNELLGKSLLDCHNPQSVEAIIVCTRSLMKNRRKMDI